MSEKRRRAGAALLCAACAAAALFFATTSSPRYATNFWSDTNIYFTVGRGMLKGLMPYRDLFDHKGPLLYMLYALSALVSDTGYAGVFLLQIASLAAFLYIGWQTVRLYVPGPAALAAVPVVALVTATCDAYGQGGSAEEFCLPALALGLYAALARLRGAPGNLDASHTSRLDVAFGAAAGWVFAVKYTVCGLFFGLGLALLLHGALTGGVDRAARAALRMALGFAAVLAVPALALLAGGALPDCLRVYFFENLAYGGDTRTLYSRLYGAYHALLEGCAGNPAVALLAAAGLLFSAAEALLRGRRESAPVMQTVLSALAAPLGAGLLLLLVYWGSLRHAYYALVFAALTPLGVAAALLPARRAGPRASAGVALALALSVAPACRALCPVVPLASVRREDMAQTAFAALMREEDDPTLLDLSGLDEGFYLASGILPRCRYFANNNLNTEEKLTALAAYVANREPQFIVTSFRPLEADGYALVAEMDDCIFDMNDPRPYRLYRRVEGEDDGNDG